MSFLLDTSFLINFYKDRPAEREVFRSLIGKGTFGISVITYAEFLYGIFRLNDSEGRLAGFLQFLMEYGITVFPLTASEMKIYAEIKIFLEKRGVRLDNFDLLTATEAMSAESYLLTGNKKHFFRIPRLKIWES